ncbi:MAG: Ig-like domain-containing protein [Burkholderiales bacterium]
MKLHERRSGAAKWVVSLALVLLVHALITPEATATAIGDAAARMQPGTWVELPTNNMAAALANTTGSTGFDIAYTEDMVWHAGTQQVFFIGSDHGYLQHFTSYDATSNAWQRLARGYWMPAPTDYNNGMGHGYDHSAIDQARGLYYFRPFNSNNVYRYTIASQLWTQLPVAPIGSNCCDALEVFPELGGLVWVRGGGDVYLYRESTNAWTRLATGLANGGTWTFAEYNPVHKVLVFGVAASRTMYKLDSAGTVTQLRNPAAPIYDGTGWNGVFTVDPVSGTYILLTPTSRQLYTYDVLTDTWTAIAVATKPDLTRWGMMATPVDTHGVTLFAGCSSATNCRSFLYKHAVGTLPAPDTIAPAISLTAPSNNTTISGSITVTANATDNLAVVGVQFKLNGANLGPEDTAAPYSIAWDSTTVANGTYSLSALARDVAGNAAPSNVVTVTVANASIASAMPLPQATSTSTAGASSNSGGGGCVLGLRGIGLDPLLPLLFALSVLMLWRRRVKTTARRLGTELRISGFGTVKVFLSIVVLIYFWMPSAKAGTVMGDAAAQMQPGEWRALPTTNITPALAGLGGASGMMTVYTDDMVWDAIGEQAFSIGADHLAPQGPQFVSYTASTNTWQRLARPAWLSSLTFFHGYDHSAINQVGRILYHRPYGQNVVHRYDIASQTWGTLNPSFPNNYANCCDALEYFPELNGLVWVRGAPGEVWLYHEGTKQWSRLGVVPDGATWQMAEHNPVHKVLVFIVGGRHYRLSSAGQITALTTPPVGLYNGSGFNGVLTVDPVSGDYLALTPDNRGFYRYDVLTDTWQVIPSPTKPDLTRHGVIATPISTYGATYFAGCNSSTCRAFLYKHAVPPPDSVAPAITLTAPANNAIVAGSAVTISADASDNVGVAGVQIKLNGADLGVQDPFAPYSMTWNSTMVANGTYSLSAVARDAAGNTTPSNVVTVTVANSASTPGSPAPVPASSSATSSSAGSSDSGGGGGGGCALGRNGGDFDPLLPLLLVLSMVGVWHRRIVSASTSRALRRRAWGRPIG